MDVALRRPAFLGGSRSVAKNGRRPHWGAHRAGLGGGRFHAVASSGFAHDFGPELLLEKLALRCVERHLQWLGMLCLMAAMRHGGKASIVESLAALYPVFVVMLAPALLRERLSAFHLLGVGCAALAGVLLSAESPASSSFSRNASSGD